MDAYDNLKNFKRKHEEIMNKLANIAILKNTKYSIVLAARENKIQTPPGDLAHALEVEAFHLRRIIEISIYVLEKKMNLFKQSFYPRYAIEVMKLRKNIIAKNLKSNQIWEKMQNLVEI